MATNTCKRRSTGLTSSRDPKQLKLSHFISYSESESGSESEQSDHIDSSQPRRFLSKWLKRFPWAQYDDVSDFLTCTVCLKASKNNDYVSGKARPQKGWRKEYLTRHEKSVDHRNAIKEPHLAAQVQVVYDRMLSEAGEQTVLLMKNVYFIATECIAVLKTGKLHNHVERLGIQHHRGRYSSWEFLQSMSDVLEKIC